MVENHFLSGGSSSIGKNHRSVAGRISSLMWWRTPFLVVQLGRFQHREHPWIITHRIHGAAIYGVPWIPSIYPSHVSIYTIHGSYGVGKSSKQTVDLTNLLFDSQRPYEAISQDIVLWERMESNGRNGIPSDTKKTCFAGPLPTSIEDTLGKSRDIVPFSKWGFTIPSGNDCHSSLLNMAPILTVMIDIYGNPLVMTNSSPWLSQMAHRNR